MDALLRIAHVIKTHLAILSADGELVLLVWIEVDTLHIGVLENGPHVAAFRIAHIVTLDAVTGGTGDALKFDDLFCSIFYKFSIINKCENNLKSKKLKK